MHRIGGPARLQKAVEHAQDLFDKRKPAELLQKADRIGFFRHIPGGILRLAHGNNLPPPATGRLQTKLLMW